jgi:hypothetical protein
LAQGGVVLQSLKSVAGERDVRLAPRFLRVEPETQRHRAGAVADLANAVLSAASIQPAGLSGSETELVGNSRAVYLFRVEPRLALGQGGESGHSRPKLALGKFRRGSQGLHTRGDLWPLKTYDYFSAAAQLSSSLFILFLGSVSLLRSSLNFNAMLRERSKKGLDYSQSAGHKASPISDIDQPFYRPNLRARLTRNPSNPPYPLAKQSADWE